MLELNATASKRENVDSIIGGIVQRENSAATSTATFGFCICQLTLSLADHHFVPTLPGCGDEVFSLV
jgi:hypothetical protein